MPAIHIRDVPAGTVAALKERAIRHGRSMQQELRDLLIQAAAEPLPQRKFEPLRLTTVRTGRTTSWTRDEIYGDDDR